ncbi:MAG TPA: glycoside hydrolase N-terminal domain-containing protein, partial [Puia sp.]|nr:glycoside hydrolase N-terminal domain-containing protein [Puia sp.]
MVYNRMNTLYLWNGHPFASLVRLPDYPYAVEVDDATFRKNEEMYRWLATEADRRGIWLIQLFYNIIVSKPFAEHNHIKTQDRGRHIVPLIADYTRKSIAAFVKKYPNVGLMVTLGEAMEGVGQDDIDWFTGTVLPGIRDGLRALGRKDGDEPPVVLRAHDTDGPAVMKAALPLYKNLYVECKYNGEALTTYTPHGPWAELHRKLSHISKALIENVHIMANLEPFRYGSPDFIRKCVQAMHSVYGAGGLHLYPQASYWDWPYTADKTEPRLLEMERDWIWYKAWARYAWNSHRDRQAEVLYWSRQLAARYGCDEAHGKEILAAYEQTGEIAPKLLRRFGITDGNRQTLTLGMLMTQLIDPERFGLFSLLYDSEGPPGESLAQYAEKEWTHQPHEGETPPQVCKEVTEAGELAVAAIDQAAGAVTKQRDEFARLRNDMECYKYLADCYAAKARAALYVLRYKYSGNISDLKKAAPLLHSSLLSFRKLTKFTTPAYLYANSMQTAQRKIPMRGVDGTYKTWAEMLPVYQKEYDHLIANMDSFNVSRIPPHYTPVDVSLEGDKPDGGHNPDRKQPLDSRYNLDSGARPFRDSNVLIRAVAAPIKGLLGIPQPAHRQLQEGTKLQFTCKGSVDMLIGFFNEKNSLYVQPPQLETDANANDHGQADTRIANGIIVEGMPSVHVHAWSFGPGTHTLELGKGLCLVLGFVRPLDKASTYDAGLNEPGKRNLDWLFELPPAQTFPPAGTLSPAQKLPPAQTDMRLWYRQPAEKWTEALPIGNGDLGAMIFGGVGGDHLQFNESTLWTGGPRSYQREDAWRYLDSIRKLLFAGRQAEAEALGEQHFMGKKDGDDSVYAIRRSTWLIKVRQDTTFARPDLDDRDWKTMTIPTADGWEAAGLQGLDGAVWFRRSFELPADRTIKDTVLELGRMRDMDFTYVNGIRVGSEEGISKKRVYRVPGTILHPGMNIIAIQVINFDDKGGLTGLKGKAMMLEGTWRYKIQDDTPPPLPKYQAQYQPFGDLYLEFPDSGHNYRRQLDIGNAIAATTYEDKGVHYTREYFASASHHVLAVHLAADKPHSIDLHALLKTPHKEFSTRRIDDSTLALYVKVSNGALKGVSYLRVQASGGQVKVSDRNIIVKDADTLTFYLTAATNFINYRNISGNPERICSEIMRKLPAYHVIRAAHIQEYRRYFDAFSIRLGPSAGSLSSAGPFPTDERILQYTPQKDPELLALYVQYARYLLISSSNPHARLPANLQGIWNDLLTPPWGSKYTTNINLEMNYWPAEVLNLSGCSNPLFRRIKDLAVAGAATAKAYYRAPGWVLHHNTDLWCGTAPINASNHGIWVTGGAWLCHQIWEHYLFTRDKTFLREYYPVIKAAAEFFTRFLIKDPITGRLISTPSNSPEHGGLVAGPAMDHQIIRDLFKNCIIASETLNIDPAFRKLLSEKVALIAPDKIGRHGQLQEWMEDKDDTADTHRHISHLWGVYPGTDITWKDTTMMKAARQSLIYRGDEGTGWSLAWKVNCWARFRDGDHAMSLLNKLLSSAVGATGEKGGVYPNMLDAHPPFQIDGNFGGAAGVAEMLVQSQDGVIELLPALPHALPDGEVKGICARGDFELDIKWQKGILQSAKLFSRLGGKCAVRYKDQIIRLNTRPGQRYPLTFEGHQETSAPRHEIPLNTGWETTMDSIHWKQINIPHNWDTYGGYRRLKHGNLHGTAWYRKHFTIGTKASRYFLFFEGVGSYATVNVNGKLVGTHAGGRTSFTLDITNAVHKGADNLITVKADHPANIRDLPWVCGGCSDERGFSEGSQPLGIFRPVHLVMTSNTRIEPFGVHIWNDSTANADSARLYIETEIKNYSTRISEGRVIQRLIDDKGNELADVTSTARQISPGETRLIRQVLPALLHPRLWSMEDPCLYTLETEWLGPDGVLDRVRTPYGIRTIRWTGTVFLLNGKPVFINGVGEYEHKLGGSHAFSKEEIKARVMEIKAGGFNAFRDAHQPHNLLYQHLFDSLGMLWWPQLSAHIWFDTPAFRRNFRQSLVEWVKERRNSPSLVLWGLQNESKLPADFARECTELIRQLDPTTSSQRKVTTCNGGEGTDWDVPQNWTGTYGGDPEKYAEDLRKQVLVGEYGGWRTLDLHGDTAFSEDRLCRLMETKIRWAETVKDEAAGQFFWVFSSHDNPGRVQSGEGLRQLDKVGPVNYKGLLTPWGEPLDVFYMFRANFAPKTTAPIVYIVSHTWPDRWTGPGVKNGIEVYSNCDEVRLFNDVDGQSLGRKKNPGRGRHFQWDSVDIRYNVLYAVGYVNGRPVAHDDLVLHHLPEAPHFKKLVTGTDILRPATGYNYIYRVNCGGADYTDVYGHLWRADEGSHSWTDDYPGLPAYFASQRMTFDPIGGTSDWPLFQDFRFGLGKLGYTYPVQDGEYRVELYFAEPWYGRGGGVDCTGWRLFDIAINNDTVARDVDLWKEAGYSRAVKKTFQVHVTG